MGNVPQGLNPLLEIEVAQVFLHHVRHGHAQPRREILHRHSLLFLGILEQSHQAVGEAVRVSRWIKLDGKLLALRHLTKVSQISTDDGNPVGAGEMCNATASCRRRIWHHGDAGALKKIRQPVFRNITAEFDPRIAGALLFNRVRVTCSLRVISAGNYKFRPGDSLRDEIEGLYHEFEALIGAPFAERQNALNRRLPS
jgi:hypothetical protein